MDYTKYLMEHNSINTRYDTEQRRSLTQVYTTVRVENVFDHKMD